MVEKTADPTEVRSTYLLCFRYGSGTEGQYQECPVSATGGGQHPSWDDGSGDEDLGKFFRQASDRLIIMA